jgi:hypothetical protein
VVGQSGIVPFIYVDRLKPVIERINANGGQIVMSPYPEGDLTVALFRDPMGDGLSFATSIASGCNYDSFLLLHWKEKAFEYDHEKNQYHYHERNRVS